MLRQIASFFAAFFLTLAIILPLAFGFVAWNQWTQPPKTVSELQQQVPIPAGSQQVEIILLAVAGKSPSFMAVRLDGPANKIQLLALPAAGVVSAPTGSDTLAGCYAAAGPARVTQLLGQTLGSTIPHYLAATSQGWDRLTGSLEHPLSETLEALSPSRPQQLAAAWQGCFSQMDLAQLTQNIRDAGGSILTNLTAVDLLALEQLCGYLAQSSPRVTAQVISGSFEPGEERYDFSQAAQQELAALVS